MYLLKSVQESNSKGTWPGWSITFDSFLNKPENQKTCELTKDFYQNAMESDIFGKVEFDSKPQENQIEEKEEDTPF